jgi:hypothetical protein
MQKPANFQPRASTLRSICSRFGVLEIVFVFMSGVRRKTSHLDALPEHRN